MTGSHEGKESPSALQVLAMNSIPACPATGIWGYLTQGCSVEMGQQGLATQRKPEVFEPHSCPCPKMIPEET